MLDVKCLSLNIEPQHIGMSSIKCREKVIINTCFVLYCTCAFGWCVKDIVYDKNVRNGKLQGNQLGVSAHLHFRMEKSKFS